MGSNEGASRVVVIGSTPIAGGVADGLRRLGSTVEVVAEPGGTEAEVHEALDQAEAALGGVDQVVHAWVPDSLLSPATFMEIDDVSWIGGCERSLEVAWWVARQAIPPLRRSRGSLVFLVPTVGMSGGAGFTMLGSYAEGVRVLAKGCGRQLGSEGVTANTVATAPQLWVEAEAADALTRSITLSVPAFGGPGDAADDIGPLVALLASPQAHFLTAATLTADGGTWMGL